MKKYICLIGALALLVGACSSPSPTPTPTPTPAPAPAPVITVSVAAFSQALTAQCGFSTFPTTNLTDLWSVLQPNERNAPAMAGLACAALITPTTPYNQYYPGTPVPALVRGSLTVVARNP